VRWCSSAFYGVGKKGAVHKVESSPSCPLVFVLGKCIIEKRHPNLPRAMRDVTLQIEGMRDIMSSSPRRQQARIATHAMAKKAASNEFDKSRCLRVEVTKCNSATFFHCEVEGVSLMAPFLLVKVNDHQPRCIGNLVSTVDASQPLVNC